MTLVRVGRAKRLVGSLVACAALPLLGGGGLVAYLRGRVAKADRSTAKLCDATAIGDAVADVERAGRRLGLQARSLPADADHDARLVFTPQAFRALPNCQISHAGGRVVAKQRLQADGT
ncbi:MAG: hypothetical protein R3B13_31740 [Polyangiaceae bacterium]